MTSDADAAFPRGVGLPSQSPLFWVQQKDRYLRQLFIRDLEAITGRRLIVHFANRFHAASEINSGDVAHFAEILADLDGAPVDLFLETPGGMTDATEAIVSLIQSSAPDLRVLVPHSAKSNGTVICLAGSQIVMGAASELGPIDPSLSGIPCTILAEDAVKQENYALHRLGVLALRQTKKLAKTLLRNGMMSDRPEPEIESTVEALASRDVFFSHGSVIDHNEGTALGLKINYLPPDSDLWKRLWLLYCIYAHDVQQNGFVKLFETRVRSIALRAPG